MKVGDLIYDHGLGRSAIILEILEERPVEIHASFEDAARYPRQKLYYRVLYDDGIIDSVCDFEVEPVDESR